VQVLERIGPELYRVSIGQRVLSASSAAVLEPGVVLKARVERSGDAILLRIITRDSREALSTGAAGLSAAGLPRDPAAAILSAAGLPTDAAALAAVAALLREGMAPDARALARVRRAALREGTDGGEWTDLAAKMEAKGISAEGAILEELGQGYAYGSSDGREKGERREPDAEHEPGEGTGLAGKPKESGDLAHDFDLAIPEPELPRVLGAFLRSLATRSMDGAAASTGREGDALALFNHLRGPENSWVIVPFRFALDSVDFIGSFRIQLPYIRGGQGLFEARFSASRGSKAEDWFFSLSFGGGRASSLRVESPTGSKGGLAAARFGALTAALAAFSCSARIFDRRDAARTGNWGLDLDA